MTTLNQMSGRRNVHCTRLCSVDRVGDCQAMPWEQWAENTDHIYISQFFQFFSEVIELNTFILKGLKLPGVHVHPFPLLFGNTQRGVQPKLGALRLAPLEILRAKRSNQAAIQQASTSPHQSPAELLIGQQRHRLEDSLMNDEGRVHVEMDWKTVSTLREKSKWRSEPFRLRTSHQVIT